MWLLEVEDGDDGAANEGDALLEEEAGDEGCDMSGERGDCWRVVAGKVRCRPCASV